MRARSVASRKLLGCSSPVETQLFIQTRAISSYSSLRAGRMVGGAIQSVPDSNVAVSGAKKKPRDNIARASSTQSNEEDHSAACVRPFVVPIEFSPWPSPQAGEGTALSAAQSPSQTTHQKRAASRSPFC